MRSVVALAVVAASLLLPTGAGAGSITYRDRLDVGGSIRVSVVARSRASFEIVLRAPRAGRTQLFLSGEKAPRGGPLIDTRTYRCPRSGIVRVCRASYETLPPGTYTWRVIRASGGAGPVSLTVRW